MTITPSISSMIASQCHPHLPPKQLRQYYLLVIVLYAPRSSKKSHRTTGKRIWLDQHSYTPVKLEPDSHTPKADISLFPRKKNVAGPCICARYCNLWLPSSLVCSRYIAPANHSLSKGTGSIHSLPERRAEGHKPTVSTLPFQQQEHIPRMLRVREKQVVLWKAKPATYCFDAPCL